MSLIMQTTSAAVAEGVERSSSNQKVGSLIPSLPHLHAEVSLGKMLNPELPLIEYKESKRCTVWMCGWMGEW